MRPRVVRLACFLLLDGCTVAPPKLPKVADGAELFAAVRQYRGRPVAAPSRATGLQLHVASKSGFRAIGHPAVVANQVVVGATGLWIYVAAGDGVVCSRDAGKSFWTTGGTSVREVQRISPDPNDPQRVFAATARGLFHARDVTADGNPWEVVPGTADRFCTDIVRDAKDPAVLWIGTETGLLVSRDGGRTVTALGPDVRVRRILKDRTDPAHLYLATDGAGILHSRDGGRRWRTLLGAPEVIYCLSQDPLDPKRLYCGSRGAVLMSGDDGATWHSTSKGLGRDLAIHDIVFHPNNRHIVLLGTADGVYASSGGVLWGRIGLPGAVVRNLLFAARPDVPAHPLGTAAGRLPPPIRRRLPSRPVADKAYPGRLRQVGRLIADRTLPPPGPEFLFVALARIKEGRASSALWTRLLAGLDHLDKTGAPDVQTTLAALALRLHCRVDLPVDVDQRLRQSITQIRPHCGDSEDRQLIYHAVLLLAAQTWPETPAAAWFTGRSTADNYATARGWLRSFTRGVAHHGMAAFDSPARLHGFITPLLALYDFVTDGEIQEFAAKTLDILLADYLSESLHGAWCGALADPSEHGLFLTQNHPVSGYHYTFAGGIARPQQVTPWLAGAAYTWYQPPAQLAAIANDRSKPYELRESKRPPRAMRGRGRGGQRDPDGDRAWRQTYMTETFALGSVQGGALHTIAQHSWGVTWRGSGANATLFTVHPHSSATELSRFTAGDPHQLVDLVTAAHPGFDTRDKWVARSPFERLRQDRNVLLALYEFPSSEKYKEVSLCVPDCLRVHTAQGWLFGTDGDFHVAIHPSRPGVFERDPAGRPLRRYRCKGDTVGFVVIAESRKVPPPGAKAARGFAAFEAAILATNSPVLEEQPGKTALAYTPPGREHLSIESGRSPDQTSDYLYDSPFVQSAWNSGKVILRAGGKSHTIEF